MEKDIIRLKHIKEHAEKIMGWLAGVGKKIFGKSRLTGPSSKAQKEVVPLAASGYNELEVIDVKEVVLRIPDEVQDALGVRRELAKEIVKRLAVSLYAEGKISLGKAVELSGVGYSAFLELLAGFGVDLNYDEEDLASDVEVLRRLRRDGG